MTERVIATTTALEWIERLRAEHGELMFYLSGGCCDGTAPMCYRQGQFRVGQADLLVGQIGNAPFYIAAALFEYWQHMQIILDVGASGGDSFSLEVPYGIRFIVHSRLFDDAEIAQLPPLNQP